jgi:preprotein translocase subunit SecD
MPASLQNPLLLWLVLSAVWAALAYALARRELRTRATFYGSLLIGCVVAFWPPYDRVDEAGNVTQAGKIKLGLDLRGGIHLVLQVMTDDALVTTVDDGVQTGRGELQEKGITFAGVQRKDTRSFTVTGVEPARVKDARDILEDHFRSPNWDVREESEGNFALQMSDSYAHSLRDQTVKETIRTLERRVNELGVAEPVIAQQGTQGDQILVQLPGVKDVESAKRVINRTAQLSLKIVEDKADTQESLLGSHGGKIPDNMEVLQGQGEEAGRPVYYLLRRESVITGRDLKTAYVGSDENGATSVHFSLKPEGSDRFGRATGSNIGRLLAIILDGNVESAPVIHSKITSEGQITGGYTREKADELAKVLRAGALPASLKYLHQLSVGASLGKDSIRAGVSAAIAGMGFLAIFLLVYYRLSGLNAIVALTANVVILLGCMAYMGATLTLPGIAGIILTIGVGVDTNVLVFERIREELAHGKPVRTAINNGFDRVWIIILDTHATALIAAAFLFQFGTGPIKGFAVTLVWGLIANVFASYFVSKFIFDWVLGKRQVGSLSV